MPQAGEPRRAPSVAPGVRVDRIINLPDRHWFAEALVLDLLEWIGPTPRSYVEVLDAWRTSCPRLPVWEEANDRHFVTGHHEAGRGRLISVSPAGWAHLRLHRPSPDPAN